MLKCIIIGPYGVGKTSLVTNQGQVIQPTIGVEVHVKWIGGKKLQVWDTAGHERYRMIIHQYYNFRVCAVFCFSLVDIDSFYALDKMINEFYLINRMNITKILVGTFADLTQRIQVTQDMIDMLMDKYGILYYFDVSSKTKHNIDRLFNFIVDREEEIHNQVATEKTALVQPEKRDTCCRCVIL